LLTEVSAVPTRLSLAALLFASSWAMSAPAPLPKPERFGSEVVFDAQSSMRARTAVRYLRSSEFRSALLQTDEVRQGLEHLAPSQRLQWLAARISVTSERSIVRLRLSGGNETLAILKAAAGQLTGAAPVVVTEELPGGGTREVILDPEARRQRALALRDEARSRLGRNRWDRGGPRRGFGSREGTSRLEEQAARYEIEANPLRMHVEPRLTRLGR
jgi:hypothetical protein